MGLFKRKNQPPEGEPGRTTVHFQSLRYAEGDRTLELTWEARMQGHSMAYAPSPRLWREIMPDWAKERREEILESMKRQTAGDGFDWLEYDKP